MDAFDVFTPNPSTTEDNDLLESPNTHVITDEQKEDFAEFISNDPAPTIPNGDLTSSEVPERDPFDFPEQFDTSPLVSDDLLFDNSINQPTADVSSFNMFFEESISPLQAILKKREEEIAAKDAEENRKIEALRQQAKTDLENWYNERRRQLEQKHQRTKSAEENFQSKNADDSSKESCDWSKVLRLLDFTDEKQTKKSSRDLTRMKACLFNAKRHSDKKKLANGL